jgi:hypothetical protein
MSSVAVVVFSHPFPKNKLPSLHQGAGGLTGSRDYLGFALCAVLVGEADGDGAKRGMVTIVELIDPFPYIFSFPDLGG